MKKLVLCLLVFATTASFAQDDQAIKKDFQNIINYTQQMQINKVLDMTYPPLFKIMPKAQMAAMAEGAMKSMGVKTIYEQVPVNLVLSPVKKAGSATICVGKYSQSMVMQSSNKQMLDMIVKNPMQGKVVEKVGADKVRIKGTDYLLAIKDANTGGSWKYLRYDSQDAQINAKVLSKDIQTGATALKTTLK